jgi:hypothetical protein
MLEQIAVIRRPRHESILAARILNPDGSELLRPVGALPKSFRVWYNTEFNSTGELPKKTPPKSVKVHVEGPKLLPVEETVRMPEPLKIFFGLSSVAGRAKDFGAVRHDHKPSRHKKPLCEIGARRDGIIMVELESDQNPRKEDCRRHRCWKRHRNKQYK